MRLDKFLSNLKYGTRKDIKDECRKRTILVNGVIEKNSGRKIDPINDVVTFKGEVIEDKGVVYLMLNKPSGYVSANTDELHKTALDLINHPYDKMNLAIAGRLDIDTEGLLLLSNDGEFIHKITSPKHKVDKVYYVELEKEFEDTYYEVFKAGFEIYNGKGEPYTTKPAKLEKLSNNTCHITISEGKYHQVKRMFKYVGNEVTYLKRIQVGNLKLGELKLGEYIEFDIDDI